MAIDPALRLKTSTDPDRRGESSPRTGPDCRRRVRIFSRLLSAQPPEFSAVPLGQRAPAIFDRTRPKSGDKSKTKPLCQLSVRPNPLFMSPGPGKWGRMWEWWWACGLWASELYSINLPEGRIMAPRQA